MGASGALEPYLTGSPSVVSIKRYSTPYSRVWLIFPCQHRVKVGQTSLMPAAGGLTSLMP